MARATQRASRWAVEQTSLQNAVWDVRSAAAALTVPTHVVGADPAVHSIFTGALAAEVLRNPVVTMSVVEGAGHSPHRDRPEAAVAAVLHAPPLSSHTPFPARCQPGAQCRRCPAEWMP